MLVDFDTVEPSNLTRSILFREADAADRRAKVVVAAERLREINPAIEVLPLVGDICHEVGLGLLRRMQVVVGCVDNRWGPLLPEPTCACEPVSHGWMAASMGWKELHGCLCPGKNCYACNLGPEALKELSYRLSCSDGDSTQRTGRQSADDTGDRFDHRGRGGSGDDQTAAPG